MFAKDNQCIRQFRAAGYQCMTKGRDARFEVIDAIASNPNARSAAAVSESLIVQRGYGSVYKALQRVKIEQTQPFANTQKWVAHKAWARSSGSIDWRKSKH
jgi:hypothetical protein